MGKDFDVLNVTDALSAFNRLISPSRKKVFEGFVVVGCLLVVAWGHLEASWGASTPS